MSQKERHEACVYIGPAALCPKLDEGTPYVLITGDQQDWVKPLIQERLGGRKESSSFVLQQHTIGKPGTTKTWHSFNQPSLNGIIELDLIQWCNPAWNIEHIDSHEVANRKLSDILNKTNYQDQDIHLVIAQGDPQLTLKRSEKILKNCLSVDLSLHPLSLIWKKSIDSYLAKQGFISCNTERLIWQKKALQYQITPHAIPSESEHFLQPAIQYLLGKIDLEEYRKAGIGGSDLVLLHQIIQGSVTYKPEPSIKEIIKTKTKKQIERIRNTFTSHYPTIEQQPIREQKKVLNQQHKPVESKSDEKDIPPKKYLRGHIDGFEDSLTLRGWVDASDFGEETPRLSVIWEEQDRIVGESAATLERADLAAAGIKGGRGFAIDLTLLRELPLDQTLDQPISLKVIESKSGQSIGDKPWPLDIKAGKHALGLAFSDELSPERKEQIYQYLQTTKNTRHLQIIRKQILAFSATQCLTNLWQNIPVGDLISFTESNPNLNYGVNQEVSSRLELIFFACIKLIQHLDQDNINQKPAQGSIEGQGPNLDELTTKIKESCYTGLQKWEKALFDEHLRPLFDVLISTIFLQKENKKLGNESHELIDTLATILQDVYVAPRLSLYLRSILKVQNENNYHESFGRLAHQIGDRFNYLLTHYAHNIGPAQKNKDLYYYASAIDFATCSPAIHRYIADRLSEILGDHLNHHPRESKPRHWVERLGQMTSNSAQMLVSKMLKLGFSRSSVVQLHQEMIGIKKDLAHLLWNFSSINNTSQSNHQSQKTLKRWLIVGEESLAQCWMYRVEQKKTFLEKLGCEVRCIDQEELRSWSFTHDALWADAIIFCRLPAMYPYLRAISFAKQCGKKTYAEIDDLIFTSDYPAEFESYGGSIPHEQYKNLCVDYPLRLGILNAADEVIVSTAVLAETCRNILDDPGKPVHVVPNLPLPELETVAALIGKEQGWKKNNDILKIALTSGTLSHKQILKESIYPCLLEVLEKHQKIELVVIGHIELPSTFTKYEKRIQSVPFTSYADYLNLLSQASIALVPLEVHPTTDGKSAIKWMEASLCGAACICSPVKAYTDVTSNGRDVMIAENIDEWRISLDTLIRDPELRHTLARNSYQSATQQFNRRVGEQIWTNLIQAEQTISTSKPKKKVLVINVFFAPQSIGGATRVAQDYVEEMLLDETTDYDVTVLCTEYDHWQTDIGKKKKKLKEQTNLEENGAIDETNKSYSLNGTTAEELIELETSLKDQEEQKYKYRESISIDYSNWKGAKVVRLNLPSKPWAIHKDDDVEEFCRQFFKDEKFDLIQCHCCQIMTASPLTAARQLGIPYEIIMHDAWWMSDEQFLVSPAGRVIDPSDPLGHFDENPSDEEKSDALARREDLYNILEAAERRIAVSAAFKSVCSAAGIQDVEVKENKFQSMSTSQGSKRKERTSNMPIQICHIGGMSMHKGYQLFRQAVKSIQSGLNLEFTVVDHRLSSKGDEYNANWNGYKVHFIAPIPMDKMDLFYASQDVLVAPSIWPESFGLVTREALSAGLWVIASDSGALAEPLLNCDSPLGKVIRPNSVEDLTQALTECPQYLNKNA